MFRDYLLCGSPFDVCTDNNSLTYVLTTAKLNATGLRWVADLANLNSKFTITVVLKTKMQIISPGTPYTKLSNCKRTVKWL